MRVFLLFIIILLAVSCVKVQLDEDDKPNLNSVLVLFINWDKIEGENIPSSLVVQLNHLKEKQIEKSKQPKHFLIYPYEDYDVKVYNTPKGFEFDNDIASIEKINGFIIPNADLLYSDIKTVNLNLGELKQIESTPLQCMRILKIVFDKPLTDTVKIISGSINNVAGAFNLQTQKILNVEKVLFENKSDTVILNLLGVIDESQTMELDVIYKGKNKKMTFDLSSKLIDFNKDKSNLKK